MSNTVVVGTQWGDEGKGKIVDLLSEHADFVVRFQGGNNAGHTMVIDGNEIIIHSAIQLKNCGGTEAKNIKWSYVITFEGKEKSNTLAI